MVNIRATPDRQKYPGSPKTEIGEIDTRAPFQSVKAAVSLFGEVAISRQRSTPRRSKLSSENILDKETQLMLAQKELNKIKQKLESAETTKNRAFTDLERARRTMTDLSNKLKTVNKSKESALEINEAVKQTGERFEFTKTSRVTKNQELDLAREQYLVTTVQLDSAKQQLTKMRQDIDAVQEARLTNFQQAAEAQRSANQNSERVSELMKEIATMKEAVRQFRFATAQNQQEAANIAEEKEQLRQYYMTAKENAEKKFEALKKDYDPELARNLEAKLIETTEEIEVMQEEMRKAHASEMDTVRVVTKELNEATRTLQQVADEECSLRSSVNSLRVELDEVKREHNELKERETERIAQELERQLKAAKENELKLQHLSLETENANKEAEEIKKTTVVLKHEAEVARIAAKEAEKKLELILHQLEEAKAAEKRALDEMKFLSEKHEAQKHEDSTSKIKISGQEYETLSRKAEESEKLAETKLAAAAVQLEDINTSRNELDNKLEISTKSLKEIQTAIDIALKSAEMAEAAQCAVEGELRRWRQEKEEPEA